eukprot:2119175-Rhodomonas_salina.1
MDHRSHGRVRAAAFVLRFGAVHTGAQEIDSYAQIKQLICLSIDASTLACFDPTNEYLLSSSEELSRPMVHQLKIIGYDAPTYDDSRI